MHGINFEVIQKVRRWLEAGDDLWFVTITETWGASPRPVGSIFAYNPDKDLMAGSLSGGCIEDDLLEQLSAFFPGLPKTKRYGDSEEEQQRLQLPCGGSIELVIEAIAAEAESFKQFSQVERALKDRKRVMRCLDLRTGKVSVDQPVGRTGLSVEDDFLKLTLGPQFNLLIVGAGEICRYLIPIATSLDFAISICDPRDGVLDRTQLTNPDVEFLEGLPDDIVRNHFADAYSAIVALSHDARVDDLAIMAALDTKAFYIGVMGSERTSSNRIKRLASLGISKEALDRLHAPIGLNVGSKTPPEIAVSIAAQLIEYKRTATVN